MRMITLISIAGLLLWLQLPRAAAQTRKLDSLNALISRAASDTQRIRLKASKAVVLSATNIDSGIQLALQTLPQAQQLDYYEGEVALRTSLAVNYCFKGAYQKAEEHLNALERMIKPVKDSMDFAHYFGNKGLFYGMQSKYDSSILMYEKSIRIYERNKAQSDLVGAYSNISIGYQQQSNFPQALKYQQKSLRLSESNNNEQARTKALLNIGNTYSMLNDNARAEQYFLQAVSLAKEKHFLVIEMYGYTNLATTYIRMERWQKAYETSLKAAALGDSTGDQGIKSASLSKAATSLSNLNRLPEAETLARQAIAIADASTQPLNINQAYESMGSIQMLKKNFAAAIPFFEKAFSAIRASDIYSLDQAQAYKDLSTAYEETGNWRKALSTYKIASNIIDSVKKKENIQKSTELTMNYEFEKKQALAKAEQDKKDAETKRVKHQQYFIIAALAMLVLAVVAIAVIQYRSKQHKQEANRTLQQQKEILESTLSHLQSAQAQLIQSEKMASLGELTAGIAHEIQNPLNFVNNFSEVNNELIEELKADGPAQKNGEREALLNDILQNNTKILQHGRRADAIVKGMLQHSRKSTGAREPTDINALCDEYLRLAYHGMRAKDKMFNAHLTTGFDEATGNVNLVPQDMGRVILNLLNNAFYAVQEKQRKEIANAGQKTDTAYQPAVSVHTKKTPGKVEIRIADNGNGIPPAVADKIFQPFFTTKPPGEGTGLGLSLSYDIIKAHGGMLQVEAKEGEGSTFVIQLPVEEPTGKH